MSKKKEVVIVRTRVPRFRQDTPFMRAHESMVDFIKDGSSGNFMDFLGNGIYDFINGLEVDSNRDLIYCDEEDDDDDFNLQDEKPIQPHPQIKELDEEAEKQIKESLEEEERRKLRAIKNKRKKMRKKEKKRLEKDSEENNVLPEEEQEKSDYSETEEVLQENIIASKKELNKCTTGLLHEPKTKAPCNQSNIIIKEEDPEQMTKKIEEKSKNLHPIQSKPCITESKHKPKDKSVKITQEKQPPVKQSVEVKQQKKEEPKVNKPVKVEKKEKAQEIKKGEKLLKENAKEETLDSMIDEYAARSREIAALGNQLAATGQYEMAVKCYTDAIKFNPKEYKLFGNRSFCFEKLQQFESALSDAEVSLSMEPNWTKGLFRKGKALCGLKKYYEASLVFKEVLKLESSSQEATMELKRAQTLHLMEMGFTWAQSSNALKSHATLEEAIEALFTGQSGTRPKENGACKLNVQEQRATHQNGNKEEEGWTVLQSTRPKSQTQPKEPVNRQSSPVPRNQAKPDLFPVWVGSLASTVTYATLQELFNRAGRVYSIKMVLEHHCAFVNYIKKEEAEHAIQTLNGMVLEGCPLAVRYPSRIPAGIGVSKNAMTDPLTPFSGQKKECFFWRTIGCARNDCTFKHIAENKGIDKEKYTGKVTNQF